MELPPLALIIQENPSLLSTGHPTDTPTDCEPPQMIRIHVCNHENTHMENQVAQK